MTLSSPWRRAARKTRGLPRWRARNRLRFIQAVLDNLSDVMRLLTEATSTDEALVAAATLLGVDEAEVMVGLARFDLLTLTRPATERRLRELAG